MLFLIFWPRTSSGYSPKMNVTFDPKIFWLTLLWSRHSSIKIWTETIIVKYKTQKSFTTYTKANCWNLISAANGPTNTDYINSSLIRNIKIIVFSMVFHYLPRYHNEVSRQPGGLPYAVRTHLKWLLTVVFIPPT